jgi:cystathionine beta-lyase
MMRKMADPYDFDEVIDRHEVPALKVHRMVLGTDGMGLFPAGVADMDFREPKPILDAMAQRLAHGVFGYETIPDGLMPALIAWMKQRHAWNIHPDHILRAPNVLNSLSMAANLFTRPGFAPLTFPVWAVKPWFGVGFHSAQLSSVYGVLLYLILSGVARHA